MGREHKCDNSNSVQKSFILSLQVLNFRGNRKDPSYHTVIKKVVNYDSFSFLYSLEGETFRVFIDYIYICLLGSQFFH